MKCTTISFARRPRCGARARGRPPVVSASQVAREAIESELGMDEGTPRELPFIGVGSSGLGNVANRVDEILEEEWAMRSSAIVDASALYASLDRSEPEHTACAAVLRRTDLHLVVPVLVIAEVAYLADAPRLRGRACTGARSGRARCRGTRGCGLAGHRDDVERYSDVRLGTTDASIAVLADRLDTDVMITLDRRHFRRHSISLRGGPSICCPRPRLRARMRPRTLQARPMTGPFAQSLTRFDSLRSMAEVTIRELREPWWRRGRPRRRQRSASS